MGELESQRLVLADPSMRLFARVIDLGLLAAPATVGIIVGALLSSPTTMTAGFAASALFGLLLLAINIRLLAQYGQTVGKRLVGVKIVQRSGERASLGKLFGVRACLFSGITLIPFLGVLVSALNPLFIFSKERRCLHDELAGTIVIVCEPKARSAT